jgi:hypothetical protein
MNTRIQELVEKADDYERKLGKGIGPTRDEKFAELIVRECGHCMVDIMLHGGIEPEDGYDIMLKHFGVEE